MTFTSEWKTAKKAFEDVTKKSKPTETFLGVFNKGTGIEAALKLADGAKTADDMLKAMAKLATAGAAYLPLLKKSAADPKAVPADKKAAYVTAINKLSEALEEIKADGVRVGQSLAGTGKKDKVDPVQLKLQAAAEGHYQLRLAGLSAATQLLKTFEAAAAPIEKLAAVARKSRDTATANKRDGNSLGAKVQLGVIEKCLDQAQQAEARLQESYDKNVQNASSTIKRGRSDFPDRAKLAEDYRKPYLTKSVKVFADTSNLTTRINTELSKVVKLVGEIEALKNQTETIADQVQKPEVYVARLTKMLTGLQNIVHNLGTAKNRAEGFVRMGEDKSAAAQARLTSLAGWLTQLDQSAKDIVTRVQTGKQLESQAAQLPRGAREDGGVDKLVVQVIAKAREMDKAAAEAQAAIAGSRQQLAKLKPQLEAQVKVPA